MDLTPQDSVILAYVAEGLPLASRPYQALAQATGLTESEIVGRIASLRRTGIIKRLGLVVRHRELGYVANAMIAWDLATERVDEAGARIARHPSVTLCYRRRPHRPLWPYNLFAMIHGRRRTEVEAEIEDLRRAAGIVDAPHVVLFSRQCFKQRGASHAPAPSLTEVVDKTWTSEIAAS